MVLQPHQPTPEHLDLHCQSTPKRFHVSPVLSQLHWLPKRLRINYKALICTYKALNALRPTYLTHPIEIYTSAGTLRSVLQNLLCISVMRLKNCGMPAFTAAAITLENTLPVNIKLHQHFQEEAENSSLQTGTFVTTVKNNVYAPVHLGLC